MADLLYPSPSTGWITTDEEYQRQRENRRVAAKKAEALFLSCLTEKQKEQFAEDKTFKVTGSGGKNRYLIDCGSMVENVFLTKWGKPVIAYCAGPWRTNISWDFHLAQKLILESNETAFLKVAVPGPA